MNNTLALNILAKLSTRSKGYAFQMLQIIEHQAVILDRRLNY